jgi:beta-aspartyl-peptidase (threonine type)
MRAVALSLGVAALLWSGTMALRADTAWAQEGDPQSPLAGVKIGLCETDDAFAVALHGGAVFSRRDQAPKVAFLERLLPEARAALASGAKAIDVVETAIAAMEDSGVFNAGKGAIANQAGVVELDASIMDGRELMAGAVASVKAVRNPILAARLVMEKSRHVMLVGPDADRFVEENGGTVADVSYFLYGGQNFGDVPLPDDIRIELPDAGIASDKAAFIGAWGGVWTGISLKHVLVVEEIGPESAKVIYAFGPQPELGPGLYMRLPASFVGGRLQVTEPSDLGGHVVTFRLNPDGTLAAMGTKPGSSEVYETTFRRILDPHETEGGGTVGAVVRDRCGDMAAGTSTGGFGSKTPGRVGDSPIIGAGTYADNEWAAISATGHGEFFMRHVAAYAITAAMKYKGLTLEQAATGLIENELFRKGLRGGVIAVDRDGNITMPYNTEGMVRGAASNDLAPAVEVF